MHASYHGKRRNGATRTRTAFPTRMMLAGALVLLCGANQTGAILAADSHSFPWHSPAPVGTVPTRTLSQPAVTPVEPMPAKQAYPYGWFGPKPSYQWKRSFGVSRAYTQWSRY